MPRYARNDSSLVIARYEAIHGAVVRGDGLLDFVRNDISDVAIAMTESPLNDSSDAAIAMTGLRREGAGQVLCSFSCSQTLISDW